MGYAKLRNYAELVKFEHTIFALPFALSSILLLSDEIPSLWKTLWVLVALVSARTLGMALNRLIDEPYDRLNPRTRNWPLTSGRVSPSEVRKLIVFSAAVFVFSTLMINTLAFLLSPVVIGLLWLYPYTKRFTHFPHLFLGAVYFIIPIAVDIALNASVSINAVILGVAMASWVSGFDILYSLQDYDFDRKHGLKSVPVRFGIEGSLRVARSLHLVTFLSLVILGIRHPDMGILYMGGLVILSAFLLYEHALIKPTDLSKINRAFFTVNGYISILFFLTVLADSLL